MPSAVYVQGRTTRRPGAYGEGDASRLSGRVVNLNRLALVGSFPELEQAVPVELSSPRQVAEINPASDKLANIALWSYNAFNDDRVRGGPSAIVMVNTRQVGQAIGQFLDAAAEPSLELKSALWGSAGNRVRVKIDENADDSTLRDFTFARDGQTEEFLGLGSGPLLTVAYDGAGEATYVGIEVIYVDGSGTLRIYNTMAAIAVPSVFVPSTLVFSGTLEVTPDAPPGAGETLTVTIAGTDKDTGLPATPEVLLWSSGDGSDLTGAPKTTSTKWSEITSVTSVKSGGSATASITITADAFAWASEDLESLAQAADVINTYAAQGYTATATPQAERVTLDDIDELSAAIWNDVLETPQDVRADLWAIVEALGSSLLVEPARMTDGDSPPAATAGEVLLVGGTQLSTQDYAAALDALRAQDVQIVWVESDQLSDIKLGRAHCQYMAGIGRGERNLWAGSEKQKTLTELLDDFAAQINSRHVGLCVQEALLSDHRGRDVWVDPPYLALLMAGGQSGTNVGVPLTKKYPNVLDVRQHPSWDPQEDADQALARGLCIVNKQRLGWQVERSVTTYLVDDNPVFSEVSTNESFNQSIRILREQVEVLIGDPGVPTTPGRIRSIAISSLDQQIRDAIIRDYNNRAVTIDDLGDAYRINYEFRPIEPVNFVIVAASAVRKFSSQT
jgi:hypothetical protein